MRVVAVIQARTGSSRLPGKVLMPLLDRPVLEWVIRAARAVHGVDEVVVATTIEPGDDQIVELCEGLGTPYVRGSVDDVLSRFLLAVSEDGVGDADAILRVTSDCPLMDPVVADMVIGAWRADPTLDHVGTFSPRCLPRGLDAEIVKVAALRSLDRELGPENAHHRTHVTSYLYSNPEQFRVASVAVAPPASDLRITLDTREDWELITRLAAIVGDQAPSWRELVEVLRHDPELVAINADIQQKSLIEG